MPLSSLQSDWQYFQPFPYEENLILKRNQEVIGEFALRIRLLPSTQTSNTPQHATASS